MARRDSTGARPAPEPSLDIEAEVSAMQRMMTGQLQEKYTEVFGERPRSRHRQWLIRRIAWRMQANAFGDLSERARARAAELANDADVRVTAPRTIVVPVNHRRVADLQPIDSRLPAVGTSICRTYKGQKIEVRVLADGFEYGGERYRSLSAVAKAITGSHINGFRFFGLGGGA